MRQNSKNFYIIFLGIHTDGDMTECGQTGKPAIHLNVIEITDWMAHTIEEYEPPRTCFKLITDPSVEDSLGDEIKLFKNGKEAGTALNTNELFNEFCLENTLDGDIYEFRNGGRDNVSVYFSD